MFPTTLEEWDQRNSEGCVLRPKKEIKADILSVIPVLEEVGAVWCLPAALYCACLHYDIADVLECWGYPSTLAMACVKGFVGQPQQKFLILSTVGEAAADLCDQEEMCAQARKAMFESELRYYVNVAEARLRSSLWFDSLDSLTKGDQEDHEYHLCMSCRKESRKVLKEARARVWRQIPSLYQLPTWTALEQRKREALLVRAQCFGLSSMHAYIFPGCLK